jgi:hypothetical protein
MKNLKLGFSVLYTAAYCHNRKASLKGVGEHTSHQDMYNTQYLVGNISNNSSYSTALCKLVLSYIPTNFTKQFCTGKTQHVDSPQKAEV